METKVVELNLNDVLPNRFQPRIKFSEESIEALSESIKEHGVIQPIVVRNIGDKYEIIAGERRYKASVLAGKQTIPAIITDLNEKDSAEVALIENVQRKDLTPIEEAISYKKILDMGYLTQDSLALKLGKTQSTIANKLRLLNLDDDVQEALLNEKISERHARSLLKLNSHEKQRKLLNRIIEERLTVRKTDEEIDKMMNNEGNNEVFNFDIPTSPVVEANINPVEEIETLEFFNPNLESLNIPTTPIMEDSIPEVLPTIEPKPTTSFFNPEPEIINSTVPPVSLDMLKEIEQPAQEVKADSMFSNNTELEELSTISSFEKPINNIFNEASSADESGMTDIFAEKPLAPIDNLLEPTELPEVTPAISPVELDTEEDDSAEDILVPGKFFNLMPEEDEEVKTEATSTPNDFNFDFDINSLNNVENTTNLPELDTFPTFETNDFNVEEPTTETFFNFTPAPEFSIETPVPTIEESKETVATDPGLEIPPFEMLEPTTMSELAPSTSEQPLVLPNEVSTMNNGTDIKTAINMVRELADNLEKMGYIVDLDEFDFENMYQVVFKINK